jgi:hypothetical protein
LASSAEFYFVRRWDDYGIHCFVVAPSIVVPPNAFATGKSQHPISTKTKDEAAVIDFNALLMFFMSIWGCFNTLLPDTRLLPNRVSLFHILLRSNRYAPRFWVMASHISCLSGRDGHCRLATGQVIVFHFICFGQFRFDESVLFMRIGSLEVHNIEETILLRDCHGSVFAQYLRAGKSWGQHLPTGPCRLQSFSSAGASEIELPVL